MGLPDSERDPPIEHSPFAGWVTCDDVSVRLLIYRVPSIDMRWTLEVEDPYGGLTTWDETFATAQEASDVFEQHLRDEGIRSFVKVGTKH